MIRQNCSTSTMIDTPAQGHGERSNTEPGARHALVVGGPDWDQGGAEQGPSDFQSGTPRTHMEKARGMRVWKMASACAAAADMAVICSSMGVIRPRGSLDWASSQDSVRTTQT